MSSTQPNVSRKRANAGGDRPAKRRKTPADERPEAPEPTEKPVISTRKAAKKLKKKLGRSPTDAEIAAYIAKKERKKSPDGASQTPAKSPYAKVGGASAVAAAAAGETKAATWVDSAGEPPHKAMVRHLRSIPGCSLSPRSLVAAFTFLATSDNAATVLNAQVPDGKGGWHFPPRPPPTGNNTILLFYGYVNPPWDRHGQDAMIEFAKDSLTRNKCTGRLRVAREGLNGTLMGPHANIRNFTDELTKWHAANPSGHRVHGQSVDNPWSFKYVDKQPDNVMENELKVFPVSELVTYGFPRNAAASISAGGTHLSPAEYHKAMEDPNAVMIDVRNFNESIIGKFGEDCNVVTRSHTVSLAERKHARSSVFSSSVA